MDHSAGFLRIVNEAKPHVKEITLEQARERLTKNPQAMLIDVREDAEWAAGHDYIDTSRNGRRLVAKDQIWQPRLWRALLKDVGAAGAASSRAEVHRRFLSAAKAGGDLFLLAPITSTLSRGETIGGRLQG